MSETIEKLTLAEKKEKALRETGETTYCFEYELNPICPEYCHENDDVYDTIDEDDAPTDLKLVRKVAHDCNVVWYKGQKRIYDRPDSECWYEELFKGQADGKYYLREHGGARSFCAESVPDDEMSTMPGSRMYVLTEEEAQQWNARKDGEE